MTVTPLVIYLDTQDYIRLFNEPSDRPVHAILDQLIGYRDKGDIVIAYSWVIMLEFITRPTDEYREERVRRGQLVKDVCGLNAFPFYSDLRNGTQFPNNGYWMPGRNGKFVKAKEFRRLMEKRYLETLAEQPGLNRAQRRYFRTPTGMRQVLRENRSTWGSKREDFKGFPVSDELIESGVVTRFLKGECSDAEFEDRMNRWLTDPAEFSRIVYDYADKPNLIDDFFGSNIDEVESSLRDLQKASRNIEEYEETIRGQRKNFEDLGYDRRTAKRLSTPMKRPKLDFSDMVSKLEEIIAPGRAGHIGYYAEKAAQKEFNFKKSDYFDIMQMCYVPDCDLFRCDKAMADLFRNYEPFSGRLVGKLADLPSRIDMLLRSRVD